MPFHRTEHPVTAIPLPEGRILFLYRCRILMQYNGNYLGLADILKD